MECTRLHKERRHAIEQQEVVYGFLNQSHILEVNLIRFEDSAQSNNPAKSVFVMPLMHIPAKVSRAFSRREYATN